MTHGDGVFGSSRPTIYGTNQPPHALVPLNGAERLTPRMTGQEILHSRSFKQEMQLAGENHLPCRAK